MNDQQHAPNPLRVLIAEDESLLARDLAKSLTCLGYEVAGVVASGERAIEQTRELEPALVLMDIRLEGNSDGIAAAETIRARFDVPVVFLTAYAEKDVVERAKKAQPYGYLSKPIGFLELRSTIETALFKHQADRRVRESEEKFRTLFNEVADSIVVVDPASHAIVDFNEMAHKNLGYSRDEFQRLRIEDLEVVESLPEISAHAEKILQQGYDHFETRVRDKNGDVHDYEMAIRPISLRCRPYLLGMWRDVTERKLADAELARAMESIRRANSETATLLEISRILHERLSFEESSRRIFDITKKATGASAGYVALLSPDGAYNEVLVMDSGGRSCTVDPSMPMPIRGLREKAYRTCKPVYENVFPASEWIRFMPEGHPRLENVLFAPLVVSDKAVGLLGLANKPGGFNDDDALIAQGAANLAAIGLANNWSEERILAQNKFLSTVIESLNHPFYVVNADDCSITLANSAARLGDGPERRTCFGIAHRRSTPCEGVDYPCPIQEVKRARKPVTVELVHYDEAGPPRTFEIHAYPVFDESGEVVQVIESQLDITERKAAEEALRENQEKYRLLVENASVGILVFQDGLIRFANPRILQITGYTIDEVLDQPEPKFIHPDDAALLYERWRLRDALPKGGELYPSITYRVLAKDGKVKWLRFRTVAIEWNGRPADLSFATDVTGLKLAEERQHRLAKEIEHFAYVVSHDLRAPLANLSGFIKELKSGLNVIKPALERGMNSLGSADRAPVERALNEDVVESLRYMDSSLNHMNRLVDAILKLSRLGRSILEPERLNTGELVRQTLETFQHVIQEQGITVCVGDLPDVVADRTALEQIFSNLIGNAVKFRDDKRPQSIAIAGYKLSGETAFLIKDSGPGVKAQDVTRIFEVFQRGSDHEAPGEGMGLSYARTLARRHGGRIWCESEPGVGSTFTFTIADAPTEGI
jgi:PAS domain S-box-containing protein